MSLVKEKYSLYLGGVQAYVDGDSKKMERIITHIELGRSEKTLLEMRRLFKTRQWSEAITTLQDLSHSGSDFLAGERFFLLAQAFSYLGNWQKSLDNNQQALICFLRSDYHPKIFLSYYNLSVDYGRLNLQEESSKNLSLAAQYVSDESQRVLVIRAEACELGRMLRFSEAVQKINVALNQIHHLKPQDAQTLSIIASDLYFKNGNWDRAKQLLKEQLKSKQSHHNPRIVFNYRLIDRIVRHDQSALGPADASIQLSAEYHLRWKLLSYLQSGEQELANLAWVQLIKMFPGSYREGFAIVHDADKRSPFGVYLKSIRTALKPSIGSMPLSPGLEGVGRKLIELLIQMNLPIRKETLIEKIWEQPYSPAFDAKFYKLIERLRKKGFAIKNSNQSYTIQHSSSALAYHPPHEMSKKSS